jgi:hypothetical protein
MFWAYSGTLKRSLTATAAVLVGAIPFQTEVEDPECKDLNYVIERTAKIPEQPHSLEESRRFGVRECAQLISRRLSEIQCHKSSPGFPH